MTFPTTALLPTDFCRVPGDATAYDSSSISPQRTTLHQRTTTMFRISLPGKMTFPFILVFLFCFAVMNRFTVAVLASTPFEDVSIEDDSTRVIHKWVSSTPEKPVPAKSSSALMSRYYSSGSQKRRTPSVPFCLAYFYLLCSYLQCFYLPCSKLLCPNLPCYCLAC